MVPSDDSRESLASPDDHVDENLPGEMLGEDLVEPAAYEVAPDETEAEELDAGEASVPGEDDQVDVDDPDQLAAAETLAQRARSSRPVRKGSEPVTPAKGTATPSRGRGGAKAVAVRRTGPIQFGAESVEELKKVVWPTWTQVQQYFWAVLVFVLIVITYVGLLDLGFGWITLKLFG